MRKQTSSLTVARGLLSIILLVACGATSTAQRRVERRHRPPAGSDAGAAWLLFHSPENDFTARFPEEPWEQARQITDESGTAHIRTYQVTDATATYQIARSDFAVPVTSAKEMRDLYDGGRTVSLEDAGTRLLAERDVRRGGYRGREITFRSANGVERVRWFAVGTRLYEIRIAIDDRHMTTAKRDAALAGETQRFVDSFRLTDRHAPQFETPRQTSRKRR